VRQRRREFGVRLAVGATSGAVAGLVMRRGVRLALVGASLGLVGAIWTNRLLVSLLFEVSPTDPLTLGAIVVLLVAVAAIATALPARAGARLDPVQALRAE
jgi:ABC-type antimicrobial peptide transport system permease subunit